MLAGGPDVAEVDVRSTAVWALGMLPIPVAERPRVQEVLAGALRAEDVWMQRYAIEALGRIGDNDALAALRKASSEHASGARTLDPEVAAVLDRVLSIAQSEAE